MADSDDVAVAAEDDAASMADGRVAGASGWPNGSRGVAVAADIADVTAPATANHAVDASRLDDNALDDRLSDHAEPAAE
jgi:hypothetical protein